MLRRLPSSVPAAPRVGASRPGAARQGRGGRARREARGISIRTGPSPRCCGGRGVARRRAGKRTRARAHMRACAFCCWTLQLVRAELSSRPTLLGRIVRTRARARMRACVFAAEISCPGRAKLAAHGGTDSLVRPPHGSLVRAELSSRPTLALPRHLISPPLSRPPRLPRKKLPGDRRGRVSPARPAAPSAERPHASKAKRPCSAFAAPPAPRTQNAPALRSRRAADAARPGPLPTTHRKSPGTRRAPSPHYFSHFSAK